MTEKPYAWEAWEGQRIVYCRTHEGRLKPFTRIVLEDGRGWDFGDTLASFTVGWQNQQPPTTERLKAIIDSWCSPTD